MATNDKREFDAVADRYRDLHRQAIGPSGETTEFFAEYKVRDAAEIIGEAGLAGGSDILDFGSGVGESTPYFHVHLPECRLTSLDVSLKSLELAGQRHGGRANAVCYDGTSIPFADDSFDVVFTACVFHHIQARRRQAILLDLRRILKPGGLFIAFEHNPYNPLTVRAVRNCPFDENAELITAREFVRMTRRAGFADVSLRYRIFLPGILGFLRPLETYMSWLPLGAQYFVTCWKHA